MSRVFDVLFNAGQDEGADRIALPEGSFRLLQNGRLTREGRVEIRPQYVALGDTVFTQGGGTMRAWDVTTFEDKLLAFGSPGTTQTFPKDIYTYLGSGAPAVWKGLFDTGVSYAALPVITDLEVFWQAPAGFYADSSDVAYANGHACVCMTNVAATTTKVFVIKNGIVVQTFQVSTWRSARVVALGNIFMMIGRTTGNNVEAFQFNTAVNAAWSGPTTLFGLGAGAVTGTVTWDAGAVPGSTTDFLVLVPLPGTPTMSFRRYNVTTFAAATIWTAALGAVAGNCGITADSASNCAAAGVISAAANVQLYTRNLATGAAVAGPTNVIGPAFSDAAAVGSPALSVVTSTNISIQCQTGVGSGTSSVYDVRTIAAHVLVTHGTFENTRLVSKLFNVERNASTMEPYGFGNVRTGTIGGVGPLFGATIQGSISGYLLEARFNYNTGDFMGDSLLTNYHGRSSVATDGTGQYWGVAGTLDESRLGSASAGTFQLMKFKAGSPNRRQTAEMQGGLYIAGGFVGYYDGVFMVENGFLDTPIISTSLQGTAGALTQLATYTYIPVWEWTDAKGRVHRSEPGIPQSFLMTGANDDITIGGPGAHTIRNIDYQGSGSLVQTAYYRNTPNDSVFYRVGQVAQLTGEAGYCDTVSFLDTMGDATAQTRPILYTQAQKPNENVGPLPCRFIAAGRDRLIFGGLPDPYLVAFSQLPFPGEPMESTDIGFYFGYQARLPEKVTAVAAFSDTYTAFTASGIYEIPGEGPQRNGTGEFFLPRAIYSDGGCIDWRSVVDTAGGLFFQMAADKLYRITPGGEIDFVGKRIRDTLASFPVIRGAALCSETQRVVFAVVDNDTTPTAGGLLTYDLIQDVWSFDDIGVVQSITEFEGRVALIQAGIVLLEQTGPGVGGGVLPTLSLRTGSFRLFPASGQGTVCKIVLQGTYLGDSTLEGFISYDDGKTWTSMGQQLVTAANMFNPVSGAALSSGDPVTVVFTPNRREVDRFALRFDITNGTNTGGTRLHMLSLEVEANEFVTRQPARNQR